MPSIDGHTEQHDSKHDLQAWDTQAEASLFSSMETVVPRRELSQEQHPAEPHLKKGDVFLSWRGGRPVLRLLQSCTGRHASSSTIFAAACLTCPACSCRLLHLHTPACQQDLPAMQNSSCTAAALLHAAIQLGPFSCWVKQDGQ